MFIACALSTQVFCGESVSVACACDLILDDLQVEELS